MPRKKKAKIRVIKACNTSLQKLRNEKRNHQFDPKKHLTLIYKNYAKKKKGKNSTQKESI